jgi:hypothetical protein
MMAHAITKDLPRPVEDELLPPLPPPKLMQEDGEVPVKSRPQLSNIALLPPQAGPSFLFFLSFISLIPSCLDFKSPHTPTSPNSSIPPSVPPSPAPDGKLRRSNPLTDLIDTEKAYVDQLAGVIRVCVFVPLTAARRANARSILESSCCLVSVKSPTPRTGHYV